MTIIVLSLYLCTAAMLVNAATPPTPAVHLLQQGQLLISPQTQPPPADAPGWQQVTLPDAWPLARYDEGNSGWYRFTLPLTGAPDHLWGIYIPRLDMNVAVYFNGLLLGDGGSLNDPLGRNWNRPLYFSIPPSLWQPEHNTIDIRLVSNPGFGLLATVYTGPDAELRPRYQVAHFIQVQLSAGLFMVTLAAAFFLLSLWLKRRRDMQYFWFAVAAFAWSLLSINNFVNEVPVSSYAWDWLTFSNVAWWSTGLALFAHHHIGYRNQLIERLLLAYALLAMGLYALAGEYLSLVTATWMFGSILIGWYTVWRLNNCRKHFYPPRGQARPADPSGLAVSPRELGLLALGIASVLLIGMHDWLVQARIIGLDREYAHHLITYSAPLLVLFVAWHLAQRFITALNESEQLNTELEARVAANRRELENSYQQLAELEQGRAVARERERIYGDLHDDVGAKLLSLVYRAQNPAEADLARSALQDLRDVVSRTSTGPLELEAALADWNNECRQRLEAAGIQLTWQQDDALPAESLSPLHITNLGRILREAVSNAIHHAQPQQVDVHVRYQTPSIEISISDDGRGLCNTPLHPGRGLRNMELRVKELHGSIEWRANTPRGCTVCWKIPLPGQSS